MHRASERFWESYWNLPDKVRKVADKNFELLRTDPKHPSLHFKKVGQLWSARVGLAHRALAVEDGENFIWVWIGSHDDYEQFVRAR